MIQIKIDFILDFHLIGRQTEFVCFFFNNKFNWIGWFCVKFLEMK